jgi:hypothetical protein
MSVATQDDDLAFFWRSIEQTLRPLHSPENAGTILVVLLASVALFILALWIKKYPSVLLEVGSWIIILPALFGAYIIMAWLAGSLAGQPNAFLPSMVTGEPSSSIPRGSVADYNQLVSRTPQGGMLRYRFRLLRGDVLGPLAFSGGWNLQYQPKKALRVTLWDRGQIVRDKKGALIQEYPMDPSPSLPPGDQITLHALDDSGYTLVVHR